VSENATRLGHLSRLNKTKKRWQRLFFVLNSNILTMFKSDSPDEKPIGYIDLSLCQLKEYTAREKAEKEYCFQVCCANSNSNSISIASSSCTPISGSLTDPPPPPLNYLLPRLFSRKHAPRF
jgi:hypothetical protein